MPPKPSSRVRPIRGRFTQDTITQEELRKASELQAVEWQASRAAHRAIYQIETRLIHGAEIADGPLCFDRELKMVRSRKKSAGVQSRPRGAQEKSKTAEG